MPRKDTPRVARICEVCGVTFYMLPSRLQHSVGRFCSRPCQYAARGLIHRTRTHLEIPCRRCGTLFRAKPSHIAKGHDRFCSKACFYESQRRPNPDRYESRMIDGVRKYTHKVVAERAAKRSLLPGEVVHHIDCNRSNVHPDNLFIMSQSGHMRAHGSLNKLVAALLNQGVITFNRVTGSYELITS